MSFRTYLISFNRSSIEAITDTISHLNQPWTTVQSRPSLGKTPMRSHDLAICGHDVKLSYQHVLLYRSLSTQEHELTIALQKFSDFCDQRAGFQKLPLGREWVEMVILSQTTRGQICQAGT
jgi:hypothetical protein